jgi:hypothetical protein
MKTEDPPLVLVACALLWIGMALDHYLPAFWVTVAMTCIAVVALPLLVVWKVRRARSVAR